MAKKQAATSYAHELREFLLTNAGRPESQVLEELRTKIFEDSGGLPGSDPPDPVPVAAPADVSAFINPAKAAAAEELAKVRSADR